jgi:protein subunit release factor B
MSIIPGLGPGAIEWSKELCGAYAAYLIRLGYRVELTKHDEGSSIVSVDATPEQVKNEQGVHALTSRNQAGVRCTVFAQVYVNDSTADIFRRSYVRWPYNQVKDLLSGVETTDVDAVLKSGFFEGFNA